MAEREESRMEPRYAELHCTSNFSFLRGASHPEELVQAAAALGYEALAITDRGTLSGIVRAHGAAKQAGLKLIIGAHLEPCDAAPLVVWAADRTGYANLCRLLTRGYARAGEEGGNGTAGRCVLAFDDVATHAGGLLAGVPLAGLTQPIEHLAHWRSVFDERLWALAEVAL